ncbi:MAG TPA: polysaccharide deacetylase family protein [Vicinamibacterales bacterium]|nr:polysaccharide deacetylase family protein [Vicinamibacterales bacterium]
MRAILTYHSIDDSGSPISVRRAAFQAHLRWLSSGRVRVLPPADLLAHADNGVDAVAVTFDDGFASAAEAVRRLADAGFAATIFAVTDHVGRTNDWGGRAQPGIPTLPLMSWADLESLAGRGVAIEAHTCTHPDLTGLAADAVDRELEQCREQIRQRLGIASTHVAYPYGGANDAVVTRARRVYRFGHTTDFRTVSETEDPATLPRLDMYYFQAPGAIEAWGTAAFQRRLAWIRLRRAIRARLPRA